MNELHPSYAYVAACVGFMVVYFSLGIAAFAWASRIADGLAFLIGWAVLMLGLTIILMTCQEWSAVQPDSPAAATEGGG